MGSPARGQRGVEVQARKWVFKPEWRGHETKEPRREPVPEVACS